MSFVRRKRGQVLLVHNERDPESARVRQRELHRFTSPSEIEQVLAPAAWAKWTKAISWRERDLEFDWPSVRMRLRTELATWTAEPAGATHRRNRKIERLASELVVELAPLSPAKPADDALIERVRPSLLALRDSIARLLASERHAASPDPKESTMSRTTTSSFESADHVFDDGMEHWWAGQ